MTLPTSKNRNPFDYMKLAFGALALAVVFFAGVFLSRASDTAATKQISPKKPVNISSAQLFFEKLKGLTLFKGKVKALHGTVVLTADEIRAFSDNNAATAKGHVKVIDKTQGVTLTCGNLEYQDLMETMTAHDHPVLMSVDNNKRPVTILGRQMELDSNAKTVVVNQNVEIKMTDSNAEAQKATFYGNDNKLVLENDPRVYTSSAQISARRITTNLGESKSFFAEGLADVLFNPDGSALSAKSQATPGAKGGSTSKMPKGSASGTPGAQPTAAAGNSNLPNGPTPTTPGALGR